MPNKEEFNKIAVLGGGSWATALIKILCEKPVQISWWIRNEEDIKYMVNYQRNPRYLSAARINMKKVKPSADLKQCLRQVDIILLVIPAVFIVDVLLKINKRALKGKKIISAIKGMIPEVNMLVTDYLERYFDILQADLAIIAGPCHAEEVAMEKQAYITLASNNTSLAETYAQLFKCRFISTTANHDLYGVEYVAVMKNIIAIACGMANGLGYGDNFQAVLVSNAMQEIKRFVEAISGVSRDMNASAYLGDLLVTTYSQFSRNRTLGNMIGKGYSVKSAQLEMQMIAEGYYAVKSIYEINKKYTVDMPITAAIYHVLYEKISPTIEFEMLKTQLH